MLNLCVQLTRFDSTVLLCWQPDEWSVQPDIIAGRDRQQRRRQRGVLRASLRQPSPDIHILHVVSVLPELAIKPADGSRVLQDCSFRCRCLAR